MMLRALQARGPQRGAPAHGPHPARRRPRRQPDLARARLQDRQRHRHGRRALDHAGDARRVAPTLETGAPHDRRDDRRRAACPRASTPTALGAIAKAHAGVTIGSYPSFSAAGFTNQIVVRGKDARRRSRGAVRAVEALIERAARRPRRRPEREAIDDARRRKRPSRSPGTSSTATRGRSPGGSPGRGRSRRSSASRAAGSCRRRSSRASSARALIETVCVASYHDYKNQGELAGAEGRRAGS